MSPSAPVSPTSRLRLLPLVMVLSLVAGGLAGCGSKGPSAQVHYKRAVAYLKKGDQNSAVIELKNALQQNPEMGAARLLLGRAYVQLGNGAAAEKELERARSLGRTDKELPRDLARALMLQGKFKKALDELHSIPGNKDDAQLLSLTGDAEFGAGHIDKAKGDYDKALALNKNDLDARRGLARIGLDTGHRAEAAKQINAALDTSSEDLPTWLLKGELELSLGHPVQAQHSFERAHEIKPGNTAALIGLARALLAQKKPQAAAPHIKKLVKELPHNPLVNYLRAILDEQRNDLTDAEDALREVLRVAPDHGPSQLMLGAILYTRGDFSQAEDLLSRFVAKHPGHLPGRKLLGAVQLELHQPESAVKNLAPLLQKAPKDPQLLALLGTAYLGTKQVEKGKALLEKATAIAPNAAAIRTQLALSLLATGAQDKAIAELRSAVHSNPKFARADLLLILAQLQKHEFDQALASAQALAKKQPKSPVAWNLIGASWEAKGDEAKARASYAKALALQPAFSTAAMNLARLDIKDGKPDEARKRLEAVLKTYPNHVGALVMLARIESDAGHIDKGLALLRQARDANPKALEPRLILGAYYQHQGDRSRALQMAQEAHDIAPDDPNAMLLLGRAQIMNGQNQDALATFKALAARYPKSPDAHYQLALVQARLGDTQGARESLNKTLALNGKDLLAKATLAELDLRDGKMDDALHIAAQLRKDFPKTPAGFVIEGDAHMTQHDPKAALAAYRQALGVAPNGAILLKVASAQQAQGDQAGAMSTMKQWLEKHPHETSVRLALAGMHQKRGDMDQAIAEYQQVLKEQPRNVIALNNLAWLYQERKDGRALGLAKRAYDEMPDRPEIIDTYGWLLVEGGQVERGIALLQRAVNAAPGNGDIRYHLAAGLVKAGDTARARKELKSLLGSGKPFSEHAAAQALFNTL